MTETTVSPRLIPSKTRTSLLNSYLQRLSTSSQLNRVTTERLGGKQLNRSQKPSSLKLHSTLFPAMPMIRFFDARVQLNSTARELLWSPLFKSQPAPQASADNTNSLNENLKSLKSSQTRFFWSRCTEERTLLTTTKLLQLPSLHLKRPPQAWGKRN